MNIYEVTAVKVNTSWIGGIVDASWDPGIDALVQGSSGSVRPTFVATRAGAPMATFTTIHLAQALAITGLSGAAVGGSGGPVEIWYRKRASIAAYGTGATDHEKITLSNCIIVPQTLSAAHNVEATMTCAVYAVSDGTNAPVAIAAAPAPAGADTTTEKFTVGAVTIGSTSFDVMSTTINAGLRVNTVGHSGKIWPEFCGVMGVAPSFSVETQDVAAARVMAVSGYSGAATVYFQKIADLGSRVAAATAQHIKLTFTEGMAFHRGVTGSHGGTAAASIEYIPTYNGTQDIVILSYASAIT